MWSVNHFYRIIEFYERAEFNVYADLKHQTGAGQMVFAEILLQYPPSSLWPSVNAETVVCLPKVSSVKIAARWCWCEGWVLTNQRPGMTPGCVRCPGPRLWPQITPQLPAWRRGKYGRMRPSPVRVIRDDGGESIMSFLLVIMTISWPLIGQMEWCVHCGMGKGRRGGERKCVPDLEYLVLVWSSQLPGEAPSPGLPWPPLASPS